MPTRIASGFNGAAHLFGASFSSNDGFSTLLHPLAVAERDNQEHDLDRQREKFESTQHQYHRQDREREQHPRDLLRRPFVLSGERLSCLHDLQPPLPYHAGGV